MQVLRRSPAGSSPGGLASDPAVRRAPSDPRRSPQTAPALHTCAGTVQTPDQVLQARPFLSSPPFQPLGRTLTFKPGQGPLGSWLALLVWQRLSWGSSQGSNRRRPLSSSFSSQSWDWLVLIRPFTPGHTDSSNSGCRHAFLILPRLPGHPVSLPLHTHTHTHFHKKTYLALHSSADSVSE